MSFDDSMWRASEARLWALIEERTGVSFEPISEEAAGSRSNFRVVYPRPGR